MWRCLRAAFPTAAAVIFSLDLAAAADAPVVKTPLSPYAFDWNGFYAGGHVGYDRGRASVVAGPPAVGDDASFGALYGGVQAGYNHVWRSGLMLGVEADLSFPNYLGADDVVWSRTTATSDVAHRMDYWGTVRGRIGYAADRWLGYATGGFAWSQARFLETPGVLNDEDKVLRLVAGWTVGAGVELPVAAGWSAKFEYLYASFGGADALLPSGTNVHSAFDLHTIRFGLNRKFGETDAASGLAPVSAGGFLPTWEIHGQGTYVQQGYPAFNAPYSGANSFTPWAQTRSTATATAFLGMRLWEGGEAYFAPELLQGFGLQDTVGAAGFPNGEAQKSNFPYPHFHTSRLFLRQTIGFGGEQENLESDANQLASKVDVSRLTLQVGKFPVTDIFDNNSYARDPRKDFMNWSIWAAGAFDYAADRVGLAYGAVADFNQKDWALRAGYFLIGSQSNGNSFDMNWFRRGSYVMELENRFTLFSRPGRLRTIGWINSDFSGSYRETLDNPALNLDIALTRRSRVKYGYVFNVEQEVTDDIGVFGRWSWNDGRNEIMAFTDIDSSLSFGASIKGNRWGRPEDVVGIGAAFNGLSKDHRDFLAAGGLGILIGDGRLNYRQEKILETYYAISVAKGTTLTFDYQFIADPAYNADRGPVNVFSARVHWEQ